MDLHIRRPCMLKALCERMNPEDRKASYSDVRDALGMKATDTNIRSIEDILLSEYQKEGYVIGSRNDGCVYVTPKASSENARNEKKWYKLPWYLWLGAAAAILAIVRFVVWILGE